MNILKKAFFSILLFAITINASFALVLEGNIKLDKATSDSLSLSWDAVDGALGYFVYYDTTSHADDKGYAHSTDDMIEGTSVTLTGLNPGTDYYIALRVVDSDGNEGDYSKEVVYSTLAEDKGDLYLQGVTVKNNKEVIANFNVDIDDTKDKEFKIEDKNDNTKSIKISNVTVEGNQVILQLADELEPNKTYTLTVVSLTGTNGETIKAGVDGVTDFNTGDSVELNSASDTYSQEAQISTEDTNTENNEETSNDTNSTEAASNDENNETETGSTLTGAELNSAGIEVNTGSISLSGATLSSDEIKKTPELAAKKTKKLPQTGPTEWLLLILALGIAFAITRFRKA